MKDCLLSGGKKERKNGRIIITTTGIITGYEVEKGKEGGQGWRRGGERAQEGKGWENHAVSRGGPW